MADAPTEDMPDPFTPVDRRLLSTIADQSLIQRALLCTFARIGVAWRRLDGDRAAAWLAQLEPHPFYKGGQFLFDLLEIEDFMLDGPAPAVVTAAELLTVANRLASYLGVELPPPTGTASFESLPPLEPGFYLYRDVLVGVIFVLVTTLETIEDAGT